MFLWSITSKIEKINLTNYRQTNDHSNVQKIKYVNLFLFLVSRSGVGSFSLSLVVVLGLNCVHYFNQTLLVSVVYSIFKTLFNYISVTLDKGNE